MNYNFILIGICIVIAGVSLAVLDRRRFLKNLKDRRENRIMLLLEALIATPALLGIVLFFFGFLAVLKGFGFF